MDERSCYTLPFDDDDDEFGFEEGHAELASDLHEYADEDDEEFDEFEQAGIAVEPATEAGVKPALSPTKATAKKSVAKK